MGIDGTKILTHNIGRSFGRDITPEIVFSELRESVTKDGLKAAIIAYGYGDGGGGPTEEMVTALDAISKAPLAPKVVHGGLRESFKGLETRRDLHEWRGEILLDVHTGTYTANTFFKSIFRHAEITLRDAGTLAVIEVLSGKRLSQSLMDSLTDAWKEVVLASFHDVVTGTSKKEVYDDVELRLEKALKPIQGYLEEMPEIIMRGEGQSVNDSVIVVNTLGWDREFFAELRLPKGKCVDTEGEVQVIKDFGNEWIILQRIRVPALSITAFRLTDDCRTDISSTMIEEREMKYWVNTSHFNAIISKNGELEFLEARSEGQPLLGPSNSLTAYFDIPELWEAWDISEGYTRNQYSIVLGDPKIIENGPLRAILRFEGKIKDSGIAVEYVFFRDMPLMKVRYVMDWHQRNILLKAWFKHAEAERVFFGVPYSAVERLSDPTSEYPLTEWMDLISDGYGVVFMAKCPRGVTLTRDKVGISLIKSSMQPNPLTDYGEVKVEIGITYHRGTNYVNAARAFKEFVSSPLLSYGKVSRNGSITGLLSMKSGSTFLEALHPRKDGFVARLVNYGTSKDEAVIKFHDAVGSLLCLETDITETNVIRQCGEGKWFSIEVDPQEIKTLKFILRNFPEVSSRTR